jgi:uncharacterized cupin superfamily protein
MTDYAIKNLMDIDDLGGDGREIRLSRKYLDSDQLGVTYQRFDPGFTATDGHCHKVQEEAYVVIEGSGTIKLDDERIDLKPWDVVRVAPSVVRGFDAGPDGLVLIAVGGGKPEEGDGVKAVGRRPD